MSPDEMNMVTEFSRWMYFDFEVEHPHQGGGTEIERKASDTLANTMIALQAAVPVGCYYFSIFIQAGDLAHNLYQIDRNQPLTSTGTARMIGSRSLSCGEIESVVNSMLALIKSGESRLVTPLGLLQNGMSSGNFYVKTLLWIAAIDSILMATKRDPFVKRLCRVLGPSTEVFPNLIQHGVHPLTVDELADDIYTFRSEIAHGRKISQKFLNPPPKPISNVAASYPYMTTYASVLHEASVLLLCQMLRDIALRHTINEFSSVGKWRHIIGA